MTPQPVAANARRLEKKKVLSSVEKAGLLSAASKVFVCFFLFFLEGQAGRQLVLTAESSGTRRALAALGGRCAILL